MLSFACALNIIFDPAPAVLAMHGAPRLLPILRNREALKIAIYLRTNVADRLMVPKDSILENVRLRESHDIPAIDAVAPFAKCAQQLEMEFGQTREIVWLIVSDSLALKDAVAQRFSGPNRKVMHTTTNGLNTELGTDCKNINSAECAAGNITHHTHHRDASNSTLQAIQEAFLDWWLLGECDLVVVSRSSGSYWQGGAARTGKLRGIYTEDCESYVEGETEKNNREGDL